MNFTFQFKATKDLLLLISIVLIFYIIPLTHSTNFIDLFKNSIFLIDILPAITLFISMLAITKKKEWGRWLFVGYSAPHTLIVLLQYIENTYQQYNTIVIIPIIILVALTIFFIFSGIVFFNKHSKSMFINESPYPPIKRPLSITILSLVMILIFFYIFIQYIMELYNQYKEYGTFIFHVLFNNISATIKNISSYLLAIIYPITFFYGKLWGKKIYSVRAIPVFLELFIIQFPYIYYPEDLNDFIYTSITIIITAISIFIPLIIINRKGIYNYFR